MLSRRKFIYLSGIVGSFLLMFTNSCRKAINLPTNWALTERQNEILELVHQHLFPKGEESPGASDINSAAYVKKLLNDPQISQREKRRIAAGLNWVQETARELFSTDYIMLDYKRREEVLTDLAAYKNGNRWISKNITYILEALLTDPIYGGNPDGIGWKWLNHQPGYPRPDESTKYPYL